MRLWLNHHAQALRLVLDRMQRTRLQTLMMLAVIGVTLSLPAGLYVVLDNAEQLTGSLGQSPQISLFLASGSPAATVKEIESRLHAHAGVADHRFVGRDQAWTELQQNTGLDELAGGLEKNPLPDAYILHTRSTDPAEVERLRAEMQQWPGVEHAQADAAWIKRLYSLLQVGREATLMLAALLGFALLFVVGNTIRLQILTQREEIEVSQLIGATDSFIRRPFLYAGTLYGLGGGVVAWLVLVAALRLFNDSIAELAQLYASDFRLHMPGMAPSLGLIGIAALLGWLGSYWAVGSHLRRHR